MATFRLPPISPLAGSSFSNFLDNLDSGKIDKAFWPKIILTGMLVVLGAPFRWWEKFHFNRQINSLSLQKPPIFIVGHWRSGTTFLHNLLCQGNDIAYVTTYQSLFPEYLSSKWLFKSFMKWNMPDKRPADNIKLSADLPQEDEFALSNLIPGAYYRFFYFPREYQRFYEESIRFKSANACHKAWMNAYEILIKKAVINTKKDIPVIKNPVNTGRVQFLKDVFPDARFIHIYRNPISVYLSTKYFFSIVMPSLWFHKIDQSEINSMIISTYKALYHDYFSQIEHISPEDKIEIPFESFEEDPLSYIKKIYDQFGIDDFESQETKFRNYLKTTRGHNKNTYAIGRHELNKVMKECQFTFDKWKYNVPDNISITD